MDLQWYVKAKHASYPVGKATTNNYITLLLSGPSNTTVPIVPLLPSIILFPTSGSHTKLLLFHKNMNHIMIVSK